MKRVKQSAVRPAGWRRSSDGTASRRPAVCASRALSADRIPWCSDIAFSSVSGRSATAYDSRLKTPAFANRFAERQVLGVVRNRQVQGEVEFLHRLAPIGSRRVGRSCREFIEPSERLVRNSRGGERRGMRLQQFAQLVNFDEPVFGTGRTTARLLISSVTIAVGGKSLQGLDDRRAADPQFLGENRAFQFFARRPVRP